MESHTAEREGISKLPAPILQHILSFLSLKESVKTCVLSKSWRYLGSTRPKLVLRDFDFRGGQEELRNVLDKSLQVYSDQKLSIEDFRVFLSMADPELVSLLGKWIPIVVHDLGVKKFHLSFSFEKPTNFVMPSAVFESDTLQELYLESCSLSQVNSLSKKNHLKTLHLRNICIEEETFAKIMSRSSLIEDLSLEGLGTINVPYQHNLTNFDLDNNGSIEIYLPNWFHHHNYFPHVTSLCLTNVPLSNEWFNSLSPNFPCLEKLQLFFCNGFDKFQLSSHSIKNLYITMYKSTIDATIDAPSIKEFQIDVNFSQSISFTTTYSEWNRQIHLPLNEKVSLCFLNLSLTCLRLTKVPLSNEWFNSFSRNYPCLEELRLIHCNGFDEFQLSSRSVKNLRIRMDESTIKATIDAPSIKEFHYVANTSQSISFSTTSSEWNSQIALWLDLDATLWFPKISELVAAFSQSQINSLVIFHSGSGNQHIEHLSDISVCCCYSYNPVAIKSLGLNLHGLYYDSFFSDLTNGLFCISRPREIKQNWYVGAQLHDYQRKRNEAIEFLCRTLQMERWEDEGMRSFWQHDLEEVSLQVFDDVVEEWHHPVQLGTKSWSEYLAALLPLENNSPYEIRFRLKWRE